VRIPRLAVDRCGEQLIRIKVALHDGLDLARRRGCDLRRGTGQHGQDQVHPKSFESAAQGSRITRMNDCGSNRRLFSGQREQPIE
jgi:hypothetical protein